MPRTANIIAHKKLHDAYNFDKNPIDFKVKRRTAIGTQTRSKKKDS